MLVWFDRDGECPYDEKVGLGVRRPAAVRPMRLSNEPGEIELLPPRSMVGQLPLEQPIGVRIPGGQPKTLRQRRRFSTLLDVSLPFSTRLNI